MRLLHVLFVLAVAAAAPGQEPAPAAVSLDSRLRDTVRGAVAWLEGLAVPTGDDGGVSFPTAEGAKGVRQTCVYGGSAGILIFLENAAAVLDDDAVRAFADRAARGLAGARRADSRGRVSWSRASPMGTTGLYTGDAGVGQAFLVRHALRGDAAALAVATDVGDALLARMRADGDAVTFDKQVDVIFGNAGTALFLLDLALASKQPRFLDAAQRAGHGLLADAVLVPSKADDTKRLPIWVMAMGNVQMHMPNFSHGTAGVAYALARIAAHTGDQLLLQGAVDGAQWLIENAVADGDGLKWQCSDRTPGVYMGGWCHGPAGTGRMFLLLAAITGDARYREYAEKGARFVVQYAADAERAGTDGKPAYVPPSYCCGVAGVVEFFCDLHRATGDAAHAAFARKAATYLLDVAIADGATRKWKNGNSVPGGPVTADAAGCNTDLMLGAAGEALALLTVLTLDRPTSPLRGMPDRTVTAPRLPAK